MISDSNNKETWEACPPGTLQAYARTAKAKRQRRNVVRATGAVAAIVCMIGLTLWSVGRFSGEHQYYFGGIACRDVRSNLEAFASGTLPEEMADRIETHLAECPACQELMRQMKQQERSAASLQPARPILLSSSPNAEFRSVQLPTDGSLSVVQAD